MNHAVTIAYKDGSPYVLTGPDIPVRDQLRTFKQLIQTGVKGADELEVWTKTAGRVKRKRLKPQPVQVAKPKPDPKKAEVAEVESPTEEPAKQAQTKKGK